MTNELIFKFISGQANKEETQLVRDWANNSEKRTKELSRLKNIWILSGLNNEIDPILKETEIKKIFAKIKELNQTGNTKLLHFGWIKYAAAIFLIVALSGTLGLFISKYTSKTATPQYAEIIVPQGERSTVVLPDGSTVKLNCDSKLKFPSSFNSDKRKVILEGEGFFDVVSNESQPFIVSASDIEVQVLGTRFNVSCYPTDAVIETYLESGKVQLNSNKSKEAVLLNPTEALVYNKSTGQYSKLKQHNQYMSDWINGVFTINNETIEVLARKLERRYAIKINFGDEEVKSHVYTGSIKDENLNIVLEALKFASSLNYDLNGDTVTLYSKK